MTIDKSLKVKGSGVQNRNVLTRAERIEKLILAEKFKEGDRVLGLPKVRVLKLSLKKKKKVKTEEGAEPAKPAAGGKGAPPAKGGAAAAKPAAAKPAAKPAGKK